MIQNLKGTGYLFEGWNCLRVWYDEFVCEYYLLGTNLYKYVYFRRTLLHKECLLVLANQGVDNGFISIDAFISIFSFMIKIT